MIIECPACATRYDIKAQLPPDGRTVRCAKCSAVWRAMPMIEDNQANAGEPNEAEAGETDASAQQESAGKWEHEEQSDVPGSVDARAWSPNGAGPADYSLNSAEPAEEDDSPGHASVFGQHGPDLTLASG